MAASSDTKSIKSDKSLSDPAVASLLLSRTVELDDERRLPLERWLAETVGTPSQARRVFISWCEWNPKNLYLVEALLDPFLSELGFEVHYYKKDKLLGVPEHVITEMIAQSDLFLSLYTDDSGGLQPAGNVIRELGLIIDKAPEKIVILREGDVKVESMTYSRVLCMKFDRVKYEGLLLDLICLLKHNHMLDVHTKKQSKTT